jgi:hypothetical protein
MTDSQSASLLVSGTHLGPMTSLIIESQLRDCHCGEPFLTRGTATGPRHHGQSRVWDPHDSSPYFIVTNLRRPKPGGPSPYVYAPRQWVAPNLKVRVMSPLTVREEVCFDFRHPSGAHDHMLLLSDSCAFVHVRRPLCREGVSAVYSCCWASPAQSSFGPSPAGEKREEAEVILRPSVSRSICPRTEHTSGVRDHRILGNPTLSFSGPCPSESMAMSYCFIWDWVSILSPFTTRGATREVF